MKSHFSSESFHCAFPQNLVNHIREKNKLISSDSKNEIIVLDSGNKINKDDQSCKSTTKKLNCICSLLDEECEHEVSDYSKNKDHAK